MSRAALTARAERHVRRRPAGRTRRVAGPTITFSHTQYLRQSIESCWSAH